MAGFVFGMALGSLFRIHSDAMKQWYRAQDSDHDWIQKFISENSTDILRNKLANALDLKSNKK